MQVGSAFGVLDPHPPGSPMLAAVPQKACGDKKAGGMRGHAQLSHHGGNTHSSRLAFITDHRPCLWSEELGPLECRANQRTEAVQGWSSGVDGLPDGGHCRWEQHRGRR